MQAKKRSIDRNVAWIDQSKAHGIKFVSCIKRSIYMCTISALCQSYCVDTIRACTSTCAWCQLGRGRARRETKTFTLFSIFFLAIRYRHGHFGLIWYLISWPEKLTQKGTPTKDRRSKKWRIWERSSIWNRYALMYVRAIAPTSSASPFLVLNVFTDIILLAPSWMCLCRGTYTYSDRWTKEH